jgi:hypothetical protein
LLDEQLAGIIEIGHFREAESQKIECEDTVPPCKERSELAIFVGGSPRVYSVHEQNWGALPKLSNENLEAAPLPAAARAADVVVRQIPRFTKATVDQGSSAGKSQ